MMSPVATGRRIQNTSRARFHATISTATEIMVWPDGNTSNFVFSRLLIVSLMNREIGVVTRETVYSEAWANRGPRAGIRK